MVSTRLGLFWPSQSGCYSNKCRCLLNLLKSLCQIARIACLHICSKFNDLRDEGRFHFPVEDHYELAVRPIPFLTRFSLEIEHEPNHLWFTAADKCMPGLTLPCCQL